MAGAAAAVVAVQFRVRADHFHRVGARGHGDGVSSGGRGAYAAGVVRIVGLLDVDVHVRQRLGIGTGDQPLDEVPGPKRGVDAGLVGGGDDNVRVVFEGEVARAAKCVVAVQVSRAVIPELEPECAVGNVQRVGAV